MEGPVLVHQAVKFIQSKGHALTLRSRVPPRTQVWPSALGSQQNATLAALHAKQLDKAFFFEGGS